jgi:hypothetical protein
MAKLTKIEQWERGPYGDIPRLIEAALEIIKRLHGFDGREAEGFLLGALSRYIVEADTEAPPQ